MTSIPLTPVVEALPSTVPFVGPEALERQRGVAFKARLGANESGFGPSPRAIAALERAAHDVWKYCDPENHDLKQALARHHGVRPENIAVGEGIDALFGYAVRLFVEPGVTVATSQGAYPTFNFHVNGYGGRLVTTPYRADREDPQALLDLAKREKARLIFFANPDNPMGSWWPAPAVEALIRDIPDHALLILDEAYGEFAPPGTLPPLDTGNPKLLRFRTFSKAYGLAGARIGYVIGEAELIKCFDKVRNHFGVNRLAQAAALAALADEAYLREVVAKVGRARQRIGAIAGAEGLRPLPSATNFVTIDCGRDGAHAKRLLDALIGLGIFVRMPGVAPLNRCMRVSAAPDDELDLFAEALPKALRSLG
ncbi:pyridoxal phosphate-dependent aminotransferase [Taklimakanibacter lacteus]|uniref:pyridoxal phosphate-dependent aminotransferase n=1 Tax=Taklimakanibacter lacteus TaxID=2268456 RepID=UPI0034D6CCE5